MLAVEEKNVGEEIDDLLNYFEGEAKSSEKKIAAQLESNETKESENLANKKKEESQEIVPQLLVPDEVPDDLALLLKELDQVKQEEKKD